MNPKEKVITYEQAEKLKEKLARKAVKEAKKQIKLMRHPEASEEMTGIVYNLELNIRANALYNEYLKEANLID